MSSDRPWRDMRRHPRFRVADLTSIHARLDKTRTEERIITLSAGGCGFYGFDACWPLNPVKRVFSVFEWVGEPQLGPIIAQGNVVYIRDVKIAGSSVLFYGVEFLPQEQRRIQPFIQVLESLQQQGKIDISE